MKLSTIISLTVLLLSAVAGHAAEPATGGMLSFQGFTGILDTPSAHVNNEGSIHLMYSDQRENIWRNDRQKRQENYLLSVGLFSFFELGGRLTEAPGRARDLSVSFKATSAPLTRGRDYWPVLAAGIQDVGGGLQQASEPLHSHIRRHLAIQAFGRVWFRFQTDAGGLWRG